MVSQPDASASRALDEPTQGDTTGASLPTLPQDDTPAWIGRFVVVGILGRGGMGVVVSAYDPELERKVAIKIVGRAGCATEARTRMIREAQALATLAHPNVTAVYDVGEIDRGLYIAMEHVDGTTLAQWLDHPRPLHQVLARFIGAGRGLAAAHAEGIVHRDFKPANVLVGNDGRVRVVDFGLARRDSLALEPGILGAGSALSDDVTRDGAVVGTPAFMAPEQIRGESVDARCDQFSFCVALWEATTGARPFPHDDLSERLAAIEAGAWSTGDRGIPRWLRRALCTGMASRPDDRHPSMAALLETLQRAPARRRLAQWGAVAVTGAGLVAAVVASGQARPAAPCEGGQQQVAAAYDAQARDEIDASIRATELAMAPDVATRVTTRLDEITERWAGVHRETCEATLLRHERSQGSFDETLSCLADVRRQVGRRVELLRQADAPLTRRALSLLDTVQAPERCGDAATLARRRSAQPPEELRADVDALRQRYDRQLTRSPGLSIPERERAWTALLTEADALHHEPLRAQILMQRADTHRFLAQHEQGERDFSAAFVAAVGSGDTLMAHRIAIRIAYGYEHDRKPQEMTRWLELASMFADIAQLSPLHLAELERTRAELLFHDADGAQAVRMLQAVLDQVGAQPPGVQRDQFLARAEMTLARTLDQLGELESSLAAAQRAAAILARLMGEHHPRYADALEYVAAPLLKMGRGEPALQLLRRGQRISEESGAKTSPSSRALGKMQIATALGLAGRLDEAVIHSQAALTMAEDAGDSRAVGWTLARHCLALEAVGRLDQAERVCERCLSNSLPPSHPNAGYERVQALTRLGRVQLRRDELTAGRATLEEAMALARSDPKAHGARLGFPAMALAWALLRQGEDRPRARALARQALEHLHPQRHRRERDELHQWLVAHDIATP